MRKKGNKYMNATRKRHDNGYVTRTAAAEKRWGHDGLIWRMLATHPKGLWYARRASATDTADHAHRQIAVSLHRLAVASILCSLPPSSSTCTDTLPPRDR